MAKISRKKAAPKRKAGPTRKEVMDNKKAQMEVYKKLKKKAETAFKKLKRNFEKQVLPEILIQDVKSLLLPLGEANFEMRELKRIGKKKKKKAA